MIAWGWEGLILLPGGCRGVSRLNLIAGARFGEEAAAKMAVWDVNEVDLVFYAPSFMK